MNKSVKQDTKQQKTMTSKNESKTKNKQLHVNTYTDKKLDWMNERAN